MLDSITVEDFEPLLGNACMLEMTPTQSVRVTIERVESRPDCRMPGHEEARTPFHVLLTGKTGEPEFQWATATLRAEGGPVLDGVYISRVQPPVAGEERPWYQLVFN